MDNDYKSYIAGKSKADLYDIMGSLDKEKYPEKYELLLERLKTLENSTEIDSNINEDRSKILNDEQKQPVTNNLEHKEYASVWIRFAALILDGLLLIPFYIPFFILSSFMEETSEPNSIVLILFFADFIGMIVFAFWNTAVRMGKTGQSLGRKFLNIAVLNDEGKAIGVGSAFFREYIGRAISGMVCYIGYLNAFWDKDKQMWHDKMVKSYVYYVQENFS